MAAPARIFVRPLPLDGSERVVPDPDHKDRLPQEGRHVPRSAYWRRRIAEGAVEVVEGAPEVSEYGSSPLSEE